MRILAASRQARETVCESSLSAMDCIPRRLHLSEAFRFRLACVWTFATKTHTPCRRFVIQQSHGRIPSAAFSVSSVSPLSEHGNQSGSLSRCSLTYPLQPFVSHPQAFLTSPTWIHQKNQSGSAAFLATQRRPYAPLPVSGRLR